MTIPASQARGAQTRNRILEAARVLLASEGSDRFTTRRVAERAGVSHGMCHYHFATKRDLLIALIEHARRDWVGPLEELAGADNGAEDRLNAIIEWMDEPATIEVMRVHQALFRFALDDEDVRAELAAEFARWRMPFVTLFERLAAEKDIELDARAVGEAFASAADGLVQQQSLDSGVRTGELLTGLLRSIVSQNRGG